MLDHTALGRRVVLRYRRSDAVTGPPLTDVVGVLRILGADTVELEGSAGRIHVRTADIVASKVVAASRRDVLLLQGVAAQGWRPAEVETLQGWQLRATEGWTRRANSALPLGSPPLPLGELLKAVQGWYADRELAALVQVAFPARGQLDAELARRGWQAEAETIVMTKPLAAEIERDDWAAVVLDEHASPTWLAAYPGLTAAGAKLLTRHPTVQFAAISDEQAVIATGRATVDEGWLGLTAVRVAPAFRRRGLASQICGALETWAVHAGAGWGYLQVEADNHAAQALYRGLGYTEHHRYHYRREPGSERR